MNRLPVILLLLWLLPAQAWSTQSPGLDSLQHVARSDEDHKARIDAHNEIAWQLRVTDPEKSRHHAEQARVLSRKYEYPAGLASSLVRLGILAKNAGDYAISEQYYIEAISIRQALGDTGGVIGSYNNLGNIFANQGNYKQAVVYFNKGLELLKTSPDSAREAKILNNLGSTYLDMGEFREGLTVLDRSLAIREAMGDRRGMAFTLLSLGNAHLDLKNYDLANNRYEQAKTIFETDEDTVNVAKCLLNIGNCHYYLKDYSRAEQYYDTLLTLGNYLAKENIARTLFNKAMIYGSKGRPNQSLQYLQESLEAFAELNSAGEVASIQHAIGDHYFNSGNFTAALRYYQKSLETPDSLLTPLMQMDIYKSMSSVYEQLAKYDSALYFATEYRDLKDSIDLDINQALTYKLNYEEEKNRADLLEKEQELKASEIRRKTTIIQWLVSVMLLAVFLTVAISVAYINGRKRQKAELRARDAYDEIDDLLRDQEFKAYFARLQGQDEERKRIAQELHDGLGSMLSTVKLYFTAFEEKLEGIRSDSWMQHEKATELLDEACEEVRRIAHNMQENNLSQYGLESVVNSLAEKLEASDKISVSVVTHGLEERVDMSTEFKVYRIIQELISNVLKHAGASKVDIQINRFKDALNIMVEDNGRGFEMNAAKRKGGMGLRNIESRVNKLHGDMHIDTRIGKGTIVTIDIPL